MNYSVATLADRWQCSRQHVYGMINRGELRAFKLGAKLFRIPAEEVEKCEALPSLETIEASIAPSITKAETPFEN